MRRSERRQRAVAVQILNDSEARFNSADLNIAYKMNVDEYQKLCPYSGELEANWGQAPGTAPAHSALPKPFLPLPLSVLPFLSCLSCPCLFWPYCVLCTPAT